jgi:hypothetical protein
MTLRCKVGDSAYIVPPSMMNVGRVVQVIEPAFYPGGIAAWLVVATGEPLAGIQDLTGEPGSAMEISCPDIALLPITGMPVDDEITDEVAA